MGIAGRRRNQARPKRGAAAVGRRGSPHLSAAGQPRLKVVLGHYQTWAARRRTESNGQYGREQHYGKRSERSCGGSRQLCRLAGGVFQTISVA